MSPERGQSLVATARDPCVALPNHGPKTRNVSSRYTIRLSPEQEDILADIQAKLAAQGTVLAKSQIVRALISSFKPNDSQPDAPTEPQVGPETSETPTSPEPTNAELPFNPNNQGT